MLSIYWRFLKSTPREANLFALASLGIWVIKVWYLDSFPALFAGANQLGKITEGIISAIIAGWIFYLLFALLPEFRQKRHLAPFILATIATIAGDACGVLIEVKKTTGLNLSFNRATEAEIATAFSMVPFGSSTSVMTDLQGRRATWLEFFRFRRMRTRNAISEIKMQSRYVDSDLMAIILDINQNTFFFMSESMEGLPVLNKDLSVLSSSFCKYLRICREIAKWHDSNIVPPKTFILESLD